MNKLTPVFIAAALATSVALAFAQSQMEKDDSMQGHDMSDHSTPVSGTSSTKALLATSDGMQRA
ncbi:MAG: hypothetical protein WA950_18675 [Shinella sp.]|uniref:hypothetical protein n=1 Tax=Shinella sp. TaxID=1870904 RepID=UPI003C70F307